MHIPTPGGDFGSPEKLQFKCNRNNVLWGAWISVIIKQIAAVPIKVIEIPVCSVSFPFISTFIHYYPSWLSWFKDILSFTIEQNEPARLVVCRIYWHTYSNIDSQQEDMLKGVSMGVNWKFTIQLALYSYWRMLAIARTRFHSTHAEQANCRIPNSSHIWKWLNGGDEWGLMDRMEEEVWGLRVEGKDGQA